MPHFPTLVLCLGEPHPGSLTDVVRTHLVEELGSDAAVAVRSLGDLRMARVIERDPLRIDARALERWVRAELIAVLERHGGEHPTPAPILPLLLVADLEDVRTRAQVLRYLRPLWQASRGLSLPAGLQPRVLGLLGWPCDRSRANASGLAAWLRDLEELILEREPADRSAPSSPHGVLPDNGGRVLDGAFLVARSNYRAAARNELRYLDRPARDRVLAEQAALLARTAVAEETLALGRGVSRGGWMALGHAQSDTLDLARLDAEAWPWLHAATDGAGSRRPPMAVWSLGFDPESYHRWSSDAPTPLAGQVHRPTLVRCLYGVPSAYVDGVATWKLHLVPPRPDEAAGAISLGTRDDEEELVP